MQVVIIIPAYNEEKTIGEVIKGVHNTECPAGHSVLCTVIDDGSIDRTAQVAREAGAQVFSHPINRGLGAALATGIEAALLSLRDAPSLSDEIIVTLDADGQHDPEDIARVIEPIVKGEADIVIGSRFIGHNPSHPPLILRGGVTNEPPLKIRGGRGSYEIPFTRRVANLCGNFFTWFLFGIWVSDSQSGFRAFSASAASKLQLRTSTMEVSSEIIREIARLRLRLMEVPITARYTEYSLSKATGQGFFRGLETLWKLIILKFFR